MSYHLKRVLGYQGSSKFLWQGVMSIIVGWLGEFTWKNNNTWRI